MRAAEELGRRRTEDPLRYVRWLPLQREFLASLARAKQLRAGNQTVGKTTAALAEVVSRCLGRHPLPGGPQVPPPPVQWWVICASWSQSLALQAKLHDLLPGGCLAERTSYDAINGFSPTKSPAVVFNNGSILRIKTCGQDALDLSSATIEGALFDEPPKDPRILTEVRQRLERRGGTLLLSYTPINAPVDYLRELTLAGAIEDHWRPLTPAELVPVGYTRPLRTLDGRPMDADWIAARRATVPDHEVPVVIDGEWETRSVDRYFTCFRFGGAHSHVHERLPEVDVDLALGIDHGSRPGKQIAVLMAVWLDADGRVHVYVLDEYTDRAGTATPADDARGILALLERHGWGWSDLQSAYGDRVHLPGRAEQKSNRDLQAQIARQLRCAPDAVQPPIRTAKRGTGRGSGSVQTRSRWLYQRMLEQDGVGVHPRCQRVLDAVARYDLRDNEHKDPIDAIVYGLDPWIFARRQLPSAQLAVAR